MSMKITLESKSTTKELEIQKSDDNDTDVILKIVNDDFSCTSIIVDAYWLKRALTTL